MHPLVDAQGQLCNLVAAEVEAAQAGEGVQALGHPRQVVAGQVHIWGVGGGSISQGPPRQLQRGQACPNPTAPPPGSVAVSTSLNLRASGETPSHGASTHKLGAHYLVFLPVTTTTGELLIT